MPLLTKKLSELDKLGLQSHVNWIMEHPEEPTNPIMANFCRRTSMDLHMLVRIVKMGLWNSVQRKIITDNSLNI